jgi:diguanylate cyclase (GGDEF)-like protein
MKEIEAQSHILVVDDNPDKLELLETALSMAGYRVDTAGDGDEAWEVIEADQPDLVITDVMMPHMNGYELAERIRENPLTKFIPVIIQTAAPQLGEARQRASQAGALGFITDLADLELLLARTKTLLDFRAHLNECEEAALTDHMTGLANRRRFDRQLESEMERTLRFGHPFTLLMIDLDNFKNLNDTLGHNVGDDVIREVGRVLRQETRGIDLATRMGGDEFSVLLVETHAAGATNVAERMRLAIRSITVPSGAIVTASFGIAESSDYVQAATDIVAAADSALYEAKRSGGDKIRVNESDQLASTASQ